MNPLTIRIPLNNEVKHRTAVQVKRFRPEFGNLDVQINDFLTEKFITKKELIDIKYIHNESMGCDQALVIYQKQE